MYRELMSTPESFGDEFTITITIEITISYFEIKAAKGTQYKYGPTHGCRSPI